MQKHKPQPSFKVGDKVYCPRLSNSVHLIKDDGNNMYVNSACACIVLTEYGFYKRGSGALPVVFHATPENQSKLEQLYGLEFQDAPKPPTPEELLIKHFENGGCPVLCHVWDGTEKGSGLITRLVVGFDEKRGKFKIHGTNITWYHAVPLQESCLSDEVLKYVDSIVDLDV